MRAVVSKIAFWGHPKRKNLNELKRSVKKNLKILICTL